jgi:hypothetical protein
MVEGNLVEQITRGNLLTHSRGRFAMTKSADTAKVFWTAFRSLPPKERQTVVRRMLEDKALRRDLQDLAVIGRRKAEPARPLREYLNRS